MNGKVPIRRPARTTGQSLGKWNLWCPGISNKIRSGDFELFFIGAGSCHRPAREEFNLLWIWFLLQKWGFGCQWLGHLGLMAEKNQMKEVFVWCLVTTSMLWITFCHSTCADYLAVENKSCGWRVAVLSNTIYSNLQRYNASALCHHCTAERLSTWTSKLPSLIIRKINSCW